ncbi:MAG: PRC-barrel domain-containing protein [Rhodospirillaceae bacterium]
MLRSMKELFGYSVAALDGPLGTLEDFLFDERTHDLRYLVADTGGWFNRRHLLVTPAAFGRTRWPARDFPVRITCAQAAASPVMVVDAPLSRQHEVALHTFFEWMPYWLTHANGVPTAHVAPPGGAALPSPVLCRAQRLIGYQLEASDSRIGHIVDFLVDDEVWRMQHLVVDTEAWGDPRTVMVSLAVFTGIDAGAETVKVDLTERLVRESPVYDPSAIAGSRSEVVFHDYLGRPRP